MNDLISRQALCEYALNQKDKTITPNEIMRFPFADRPTGKWEEVGIFETIDGVTIHVLQCKKCGALHRTRQYKDGKYANAKFCPNCGAKMEINNE